MISFRQLDTVGIIDKRSGKFSWKWGRGELGHQHDPTQLENGNILIFDNGWHSLQAIGARSRIIEVDPKYQRNQVDLRVQARLGLFQLLHQWRPAPPQRQYPYMRGHDGQDI